MRPTVQRGARRRQFGGLLIEVLVAALLSAFALLAFAALQGRASGAEFEALQRSQALVLVEDMVARINTNRAAADAYLVAGLVGDGGLQDCAGQVGAARDLCQWGNLLRGSSETRDAARVGAMLGARGCITRAVDTTHRFVITVAWQGVIPTGPAPSPCGQGQKAFPEEALRRAATATVCVAQLRDDPAGAAVPRC